MWLGSELRVVVDGRELRFGPEAVVTIGRSAESAVRVDDPTVSRRHAEIRCEAGIWTYRDLGGDRSFAGGRPVSTLSLHEPVEVRLASPDGPALRLVPPALREAFGSGLPGGGLRGRAAVATGDGFDLASALHVLVPVRAWLRNPGWRHGLRLLVIPYALLPLAFIALFQNSANLTTPGWAYSLYVAPLWLIAFWYLIRPGRIERLHAVLAVGVIGWVLIWIKYVTIPINDHLNPRFFGAAIGVGYNEELTKALPILVAAMGLRYLMGKRLDPRMWMLLGTVAGLTFGVVEAADVYVSQAIASIATAHSITVSGTSLHQSFFLPIIVNGTLSFADRIFVDGFQHAVWAGISGFFMGMAVNYGRRRLELIVIGITIPALLHGFNDWISPHSLWVQVLVDAVSLALFLGYTISARSIEREVRHTPMFRGQSVLVDVPSETSDA